MKKYTNKKKGDYLIPFKYNIMSTLQSTKICLLLEWWRSFHSDFDIFSSLTLTNPLWSQYLPLLFSQVAWLWDISFSWWGKVRSWAPPCPGIFCSLHCIQYAVQAFHAPRGSPILLRLLALRTVTKTKT